MIEIIIVILILLPIVGLWASWKLWKWHKFYGSRFLWGLFLTSIAVDIAGMPIAVISGRRLFLGPDAPPFPGTGEVLGISLVILQSTFLYLIWRWRDLDRDMRRERTGIQDLTHSVNRPPTENRDMSMEEKAIDKEAEELDKENQ